MLRGGEWKEGEETKEKLRMNKKQEKKVRRTEIDKSRRDITDKGKSPHPLFTLLGEKGKSRDPHRETCS